MGSLILMIRNLARSIRVFCTVLVLLITVKSLAQKPGNFSFSHITSANGLLNNNIHSVVQDENGYIWFGTFGGLQRYDGIRFKTFRSIKEDSSSLPSNMISQLLMNDRNELWILFSDTRVGKFSTSKFSFTESSVKPVHEISKKTPVSRLTKDDSGNLFLLLGGGEILMLDTLTNTFSSAATRFRLRPGENPADFKHQRGTPYYWIALQGGDMVVYNRTTGKMNYRGDHEPGLEILDEKVDGMHPANIFFDKKNRIWFDSWGPGYPYLFCYDLKQKKWILNKYSFFNALKSYYELKGFFEQSDSSVWVRGTRVFARYDDKTNEFVNVENGYKNERSITYDAIQCLFEDKQKNIWVGTESGGVHRFNPGNEYFLNITHVNRISGKNGAGSIMSFMPVRGGSIIAGAWGDGLYEYDRDFNEIPLSIKNIDFRNPPSVWSMSPSVEPGYFWMSAQPGIYKVNENDRTYKYYRPNPVANSTIRQIVEDKRGNLWLGIQHGGVFKWTAQGQRDKKIDSVKRVAAIPKELVNQIYLDSSDRIWVGTSSKGVYVIDTNTDSLITHFCQDADDWKKLPEPGVSSVLQYDKNTFLITTATYILLYKTDQDKLIEVHNFHDLSVFITATAKDRSGYIWISTTGGLFRYNILNDMFVWFTKKDGIDNENFTLSASRVLPDGRLMFGSSDQFVVFDPSRIDINNSFPEIRITDIKLHNKSLLVDSLVKLRNVEFAHHNNSMVFEFSSLTYGTAYIDVKYKLEGMDQEWQMADDHYQATYSYLPPGSYSFLVKSENAEGASDNSVTRFDFTIQRPFYQSWWFYSLIVLLCALLLYWYDRERMKRKAAIQQMRSSIADHLHEEVTKTLNNITILSEIARLKADKDLEKSKEYIDQINDKSRQMMYNMEDMLWSIDPENDSMEKMLLRMQEFAEGYEKEYDLPIELQMDPGLNKIRLDMLQRQELFFIFKDAMNCMVHSFKAKKVSISLDLEGKILLMKMQALKNPDESLLEYNCSHLKDIYKRAANLRARVEFVPDNRFISMLLQVDVHD